MTKMKDEDYKNILCGVPECPVIRKIGAEKICKVPDCPLKSLQKASKGTKKVEKPSYDIKRNFLALKSFFLQTDVCKLSKEEKKAWKRMKSDGVEQTEQFINFYCEKCKARKKLKDIFRERTNVTSIHSIVKNMKSTTSKATSCTMTDCPIVAKKFLIQCYNDEMQRTNDGEYFSKQGSMFCPRSEKEISAITFCRSVPNREIIHQKVSKTTSVPSKEYIKTPAENEQPAEIVTEDNRQEIDAVDKPENVVEHNTPMEINDNVQSSSKTYSLPESKKFYNFQV